jgi:hypothetical protein
MALTLAMNILTFELDLEGGRQRRAAPAATVSHGTHRPQPPAQPPGPCSPSLCVAQGSDVNIILDCEKAAPTLHTLAPQPPRSPAGLTPPRPPQILEKLKLLNYESQFCQSRNFKPLTR